MQSQTEEPPPRRTKSFDVVHDDLANYSFRIAHKTAQTLRASVRSSRKTLNDIHDSNVRNGHLITIC
jgi:hypothetical protein